MTPSPRASNPAITAVDKLSQALEAVVARAASTVQQTGWRYRLAPADVDEVFQDVRIRLWKARAGGVGTAEGTEPDAAATIENIASAGASYVYKVATSAALDIIRRRRNEQKAASLDELPEHAEGIGDTVAALGSVGNPDQDLDASELSNAVVAAVERIPASRRAVVRMYLIGYPREEISKLMGWSEAKTRNLLYRGLADIRGELTARGIGPKAAHPAGNLEQK